MSSLKFKNKDGQWVSQSSTAINTSIMDVEGNFISDNVEGALRELANQTKDAAIDPLIEIQVQKNTIEIDNIKTNLNEHEGRISYLETHGGGGSSLVPAITSSFKDSAIEKGTDLTIPIFFTSPSGGTGTAYIIINDIEVDYVGVKQGNNNVKILSKNLDKTDNKVSIYVKDRAGLVSNQLEWSIISGGITVTTTFDYEVDYGITDKIKMPYNIETGIQGDIVLHLTVDGTTIEVPSNNGYNQFDFSTLELDLGIHTVSMYATVDKYTSSAINFNLVITSTNELYLSSTFENGSTFNYGVPISLNYRISKKSTELFDVYIYIDGVVEKTQQLTAGSYYWTLNKSLLGQHTVTVRVINKDKTEDKSIDLSFDIVKGEYSPVEDITYDLLLDLNAVGKSNHDNNDDLWLDDSGNNNHARMINFNFSTNGFINDEVVCDNDAYIEVPFSPWESNARNGSTIDLIYTPINSGNEEARVIDYTFITNELSDAEIKPFKGLFADIRQAIVSSSNSGSSSGKVSLDENSGQIHLTWVIDRENKFCKTYINGVLSRIMFLSDSGSGNNAIYEDFSHNNYIYLNSTKGENCGTNNIKRLRVWGHALTSDEVLKTHIAIEKDLQKQEEIYNFNYNNTTLPRMDLYGDITNMTPYQSVDMRIKYTSPNEEKYGASFYTGIQNNPVLIQGTSSLQYVRHNYTIYLKDEFGNPMMYNPYGQNSAKPDSVFCLKADYVESSHGNNTGMANFINDNVYDTKLPPQLEDPRCRTTIAGFPVVVYMNGEYLGVYNFNHDRYSTESYGYDYKKYPNMLVYEINSNSNTSAGAFYKYGENQQSSNNITERDYYARDFNLIYGNRTVSNDSFSEIKELVEWVSVAQQDLFRETISEHFNKEYLFRYLLTVLMIGGVDSLGKNLKITTFDGKVWYPTFYDLDTCLGIDNSGYLTIEPDVEIEEGSFNTSNSNLWTKVMTYFASELREEWALMRQGRFTLDNLMKYVIGNQIEVIPAKYYNDDAQVKYLEFGSLYTYCCHGNKELLTKRWLRERIAYVDSMMNYFTSQDDQITIRMNKTGPVEFTVSSYIPLYFSVKWSNESGGVQTFKLKRGEKKTFNYISNTVTDQEVIIYHAQYIKELEGLSNLTPSSCILSNAKKLNSIKINSEKLYNINVTENKFLRSIDLSGCRALGTVTATGSVLDVSQCKYLSYLNIYNTSLTGVKLNTSGGSLKEVYYPTTVQEVELIKQTLLQTIGLPYGKPNILKDVEILEGVEYSWFFSNYDNPVITNSSNSVTFDGKLYVQYGKTYTFKVPSSGVEFYVYEFDQDGNPVSAPMVGMLGYGVTSGTYTPTNESVKFVAIVGVKNLNIAKQLRILEEGQADIDETPTSLYNINIQECPSIKKLNTSSDPTISSSFAAMVYCNNLTLRNSLDLEVLKFEGFHRLKKVIIENMYNLQTIGFNDLLPVGETSTIEYISLSNCPLLGQVELNCSSDDYEITFSKDAILNFGGLSSLRNITSNCVLKGIKTIVLPLGLESMYFTNEYGSGYSTIQNLWSSAVCSVNTDGATAKATHIDSTYVGIDFKNMNLKNIDLGALVNIPKAINFSLSPTTVNPNFNKNRDGSTYPYLKPVGTLDLSNYTGSLARFFDGVDLDKLQIICNNNLPQKDLSYCFYNSSFSNTSAITNLLSKVSSIENLDYCFYQTTMDNIDVLSKINMASNSTMNYTFAECPNLKSISNVVIPQNVTEVQGMFSGCPLTTVDNMIINVQGSINGLFSGCDKLTEINTLKIPNVTDVSNVFNGCSMLSTLSGFVLPTTCTNVNNLFNGCYMLTKLENFTFGPDITEADTWYPPYIEELNEVTINNSYVKLNGVTTLTTVREMVVNGEDMSDLFNGCTALSNIDITIGSNVRSMARMFKNCKLISHDINIPSYITDVTEMFKDCSALTHTTSNWDDSYDGITPTDCYSGCTAITHIDGVDIGANAYTTGLDEVPTAWGGYGFSKNTTGIYEFVIPSDNYTLELGGQSRGYTVPTFIGDGIANWGDGTITTKDDFESFWAYHTYAKAGTYIVKGKLRLGNSLHEPVQSTKDTLTKVLQYPNAHLGVDRFRNCTKLEYVNASNWDLPSDISNLFYGCSSLKTIQGLNTCNTSKTTTMNSVFEGCSALTSLDLSNWNTSKVTSMVGIFRNCSSLTQLDTSNWDVTNCGNVSYAFYGCSAFTQLDLSHWRLQNVSTVSAMLFGMSKVTSIKMPSFEGNTVLRHMSYLFVQCPLLEESPLKVIPDSVQNITALFYQCNKLTDISGMTFGSGITEYNNWCPPNLTTANNVTVKSNIIKFQNCTTLKYANNFTIDCEAGYSIFEGCTNLLAVNNLTITNAVNTLFNLFKRATSLTEVDFKNCNFDTVGTISEMFRNSGIKLIKNLVLNKNMTTCAWLDETYNVVIDGLTINNDEIINKEGNGDDGLFRSGMTYNGSVTSGLIEVKNLTLGSNVRDISNAFNGCSTLKSDIIIPSHITNCSNMFKNCTAMTHIHSNWNNTYDNEITSTDCYSGCTGITHIDGNNVIAYEGDLGIDCVPSQWGGSGFTEENTTIFQVDITTDNYELKIGTYVLPTDCVINWGDGTATIGTNIHTYSKLGLYTIKIKNLSVTCDEPNTLREVLYKIVKVSNGFGISSNAFRRCTQLVEANISKSNIFGLQYSFYDCTKLQKVIINNPNFDGDAGIFCCFGNCSSLVSVEGVESWGVFGSSMGKMFQNCTSLTTPPIKNIPDSVTDISYMYSGCTNITSIDGMTFGRGIITMGDWAPPNLTTIQNINTNAKVGIFFNCTKLRVAKNININISGYNLFRQCTSLNTVENINVKEGVDDLSYMFFNCQSLISPPTINIPTSVTNVSNMYNGCKKMTSDIIIPSHITNCSSMFKDCIGMTHIHSNWNNNYIYEITSTDCYSGCKKISHIDDSSVLFYEGDLGLDYIPTLWGGNGFDADTTSVMEIVATTDNYQFRPCYHSNSLSIRTGSYINWGDGTVDRITDFDVEVPFHTYAKAGKYIVKANVFFGKGYSLNSGSITKILNVAVRGIDALGNRYDHTDWGYAFIGGSTLTSINLSNIIKYGVKIKSMVSMFKNCTALTEIIGLNDIDTSLVTYMAGVFSSCKLLTKIDISKWDLSKVISTNSTFDGCSNLTEVSMSSNTPKLEDMRRMFYNCTSLIDAPSLNTSNVQNFGGNDLGAFQNCINLVNVPVYDFSSAIETTRMFNNCQKLQYIKIANCSSTIYAYSDGYSNGCTFFQCPSLLKIEGINLEGLDYTGAYKGADISIVSRIVCNCPSLETIILKEGTKIKVEDNSTTPYKGVTIYNCTNVSVETLVNIINALQDYSGSDKRTLNIGSVNLAKLSSAQIKIATDKNWTIIGGD